MSPDWRTILATACTQQSGDGRGAALLVLKLLDKGFLEDAQEFYIQTFNTQVEGSLLIEEIFRLLAPVEYASKLESELSAFKTSTNEWAGRFELLCCIAAEESLALAFSLLEAKEDRVALLGTALVESIMYRRVLSAANRATLINFACTHRLEIVQEKLREVLSRTL